MSSRSLLIAATVALALAVTGCGGGSSSGPSGTPAGGGKVKEGGVLRMGTSTRIDSLNPYVAFNQDSIAAFGYVYPLLVQYDRTHKAFAPDFAQRWETSKDGRVWTFHTQPNAKWSDGRPLTAADAAWSLTTAVKYQKSGAANEAGLVAHVKSAVASDPNTLVLKYERPVANVLSQLQQFFILPAHVWSKYTTNGGKDLKTFKNAAPIVSGGPFTLKSFKKNEIALFRRFPGFYGPKPHVDGFGLRQFSNDDALVAALKANEIDAIESLPPTAIKTVKDAGFVVEQVPGLTEDDFIINSSPKKTKHRELLNLKLREAFAHAIDREKIVRVVWLGTATPATSFIPPATGDWHNANLKPEVFDIATANKLLDDLGYTRAGGGTRTADGHQMAYDVITPTDITGVDRAFQIIQTDFQRIGVKLTQKKLDSSAAFDAITAPNGKYLNFDLAMWDWVALIDPDFMLSVVTCGQYEGWSDSGYCNAAYDKLYADQGTAIDPKQRKALVWKMQQKLFDERPYIMLDYENWVTAHNKRWDGFDISPQGPFNSLSKLSLTEVHQVG